jgi:hypothetical protein
MAQSKVREVFSHLRAGYSIKSQKWHLKKVQKLDLKNLQYSQNRAKCRGDMSMSKRYLENKNKLMMKILMSQTLKISNYLMRRLTMLEIFPKIKRKTPTR